MGITRNYTFTESTEFKLECDNCGCHTVLNLEGDIKKVPTSNDWFEKDGKLFCECCYSYTDYDIIKLLDRYELLHRNNNYGKADSEIEKIRHFIYKKANEMKKGN